MDITRDILAVCALVCLSVHLCVCQPRPAVPGNQGTEACRSPCPPPWVRQLEHYSSLGLFSLQPNSPVCGVARDNQLLSACNATGSGCGSFRIPSYCCPVSCLTALEPCYDGPRTTHLCLPGNLQPWMPLLIGAMG